jgi:hypothetical protein
MHSQKTTGQSGLSQPYHSGAGSSWGLPARGGQISGQVNCMVSVSLIIVELAAVGVSLLEVVRYQAR